MSNEIARENISDDKYPMDIDELINYFDLLAIECCNQKTENEVRLLTISMSVVRHLESLKEKTA